jgi:hypothetical protein
MCSRRRGESARTSVTSVPGLGGQRPSLLKEGFACTPARPTAIALLQELSQSMATIESVDHALPRVARRRACPRVPASPKMYPSRTRQASKSRHRRQHIMPYLQGFYAKPSDGLEPSTPSLPWRFRGGIGVHGRSLAITFFLQIDRSRCVWSVRACPRVLSLMYPSRTRGALSVLKTGGSPRTCARVQLGRSGASDASAGDALPGRGGFALGLHPSEARVVVG